MGRTYRGQARVVSFKSWISRELTGIRQTAGIHARVLVQWAIQWFIYKNDSSFTSHGSPILFQLEILQKSKEEAHIMADAFRIAFEQQLMRKNEQALRLAHVDMCRRAATGINRQHPKEDGN